MTAARRFARFRPQADPEHAVFGVPVDGMCLSTFLVVRPEGHPERVLLGHLNPAAPWQEIGAADPRRSQEWKTGWMLPSSQLQVYESPGDSARRIAREQLGVELQDLPPPVLMSDAYQRSAPPGEMHWDIGFVYVLDGQPSDPPRHSAWTELEYRPVAEMRRADFVRSQDDVLRLVGLTCRD